MYGNESNFQLLGQKYFKGKTNSDLVDVSYICAYKNNVEKIKPLLKLEHQFLTGLNFEGGSFL